MPGLTSSKPHHNQQQSPWPFTEEATLPDSAGARLRPEKREEQFAQEQVEIECHKSPA
jgi:hypothetical protein